MVTLKTKLVMKMMILMIGISLVILAGCACKKLNSKDDQLSIKKTPYTGKELRIDGYWYEEGVDKFIYPFCFFYQERVEFACIIPK